MTVVITWIVACIAIISVGVFAGRGMKGEGQWSGEDRSMSMWSLAFIFGGFQIGGMAIVGAAQNGYTMGIAGAWYSIAGSCYLLALAVVGRFLHKNMPGISVPLYLSQRYGLAPSRLYSYVWIIYGFLYIPMQLITICSIINIVLPQLPTAPAMLVGITLGALYTSFAGLKGAAAVGRVCCIGIYVVLVIFVFVTLPNFGGFGGLLSELPESYASMGAMPTQRVVAWVLGGIISTSILQAVLQPLLSAKNPDTARKGAALGYLVSAPVCIFTAIIGMMGAASTDTLGDGSTAFAWTVREYSNPVVAGIIFAVATIIIAATMATMMIATGTIITYVYKTDINHNADEKKTLKFSRIATLVFAYLTLFPSLIFPSESINAIFLTLQHVAAAPVSFSIIVGLVWKRVNRQASFWSMATGMAVGVAWVLLDLTDKMEAVYPVVLVSYSVGIIVTLLTSKKEPALEKKGS